MTARWKAALFSRWEPGSSQEKANQFAPRHRDARDREHDCDGHLANVARNKSKQAGTVVLELAVRCRRPSSPATEYAAFFRRVFNASHSQTPLSFERIIDLGFVETLVDTVALAGVSEEITGFFEIFVVFASVFSISLMWSS